MANLRQYSVPDCNVVNAHYYRLPGYNVVNVCHCEINYYRLTKYENKNIIVLSIIIISKLRMRITLTKTHDHRITKQPTHDRIVIASRRLLMHGALRPSRQRWLGGLLRGVLARVLRLRDVLLRRHRVRVVGRRVTGVGLNNQSQAECSRGGRVARGGYCCRV